MKCCLCEKSNAQYRCKKCGEYYCKQCKNDSEDICFNCTPRDIIHKDEYRK